MKISKHVRFEKNMEIVAKGAIWFFVALTIGVLGWIIFYILGRGFVSNNLRSYEVIDFKERSIDYSQSNHDELVFFINNGVRVDEATIKDIKSIYTEDLRVNQNWGKLGLTRQYIKFEPIAIGNGSSRYTQAAAFITNEEGFGRLTQTVTGAQELVDTVAETTGAVGFLTKKDFDSVKGKGGVKVIPVRRVSMMINPSVAELDKENNVQLYKIRHNDLDEIYDGSYANWQELGGTSLSVRPVVITDNPHYSQILAEYQNDIQQNSNVIKVDSIEEFRNTVNTTEGAVGLCYFSDVGENDTLFEIERREVGLNLDIFYLIEEPRFSGKLGGVSTIIINTLFLLVFVLILSTLIGVCAAIYLVEYAKQGKIVYILRLGTETLAGIPSVIFGLFGFIFFVNILGWGIGFLSATISVTMMILPTIVRTTEEALKSVPQSFREGSLALGATKLQTIRKVVLPAAAPGILTGVILGLGRTVGETAVLIYTLGSNYELVRGPSSSARVLSLHLYNMFAEAISADNTFATGAILIFIILLVNYGTTRLIGQMNKNAGK